MMNPGVEIIEMRLLPGDRSLKAFADVQIGDIILRDFRVMQENGKPYVKCPFATYRNKGGAVKSRQIVSLPAELRGEIDALILSSFYRQQKESRENGRSEE